MKRTRPNLFRPGYLVAVFWYRITAFRQYRWQQHSLVGKKAVLIWSCSAGVQKWEKFYCHGEKVSRGQTDRQRETGWYHLRPFFHSAVFIYASPAKRKNQGTFFVRAAFFLPNTNFGRFYSPSDKDWICFLCFDSALNCTRHVLRVEHWQYRPWVGR